MMVPLSGVQVGDRLSVGIRIEGAEDVTSVPFHVVYNPQVLRFDHGEEGGFLARAGQTAFFAAPTSSGAEMVVGLSRLGRGPGAGGNGRLCTLHFDVIGPGDAGLGFTRAKIRDSSNKITPASFVSAPVTAAAVP